VINLGTSNVPQNINLGRNCSVYEIQVVQRIKRYVFLDL